MKPEPPDSSEWWLLYSLAELHETLRDPCPVCGVATSRLCAKGEGDDPRATMVHLGRVRATTRRQVAALAAEGRYADQIADVMVGYGHSWSVADVRHYAQREDIVLREKPKHAWEAIPPGDPLASLGWVKSMQRCRRCGLVSDRDRQRTRYYQVRWKGPKGKKVPELYNGVGRTPPCVPLSEGAHDV